MTEPSGRRTFVLVDGENIDATLGGSVLGRRPHPEERPRWERVTAHAEQAWGQPVTGLFFLNASHGTLPTSFVQALLAMDYRPVPLSGGVDEKVVDIGIQRTLTALLEREDADVVLASHDADFAPQLASLLGHDAPERRVGLLGFREFTSTHLADLVDDGLELFDLEYDVRAFNAELPRVRIIPLDDFDPTYFLR
ncbi:MAG: NYN domain-containing protein [Nocardioides sp.]|uniref:NYN domain-containing protein n=1 Tax=Nocardioides sp. TaxID=35761 RepID=UPI00238204F0|nr:NYN domain-containing protein [Nocardioides sp.]MDE0777463.1 NYN domain-containing protein [Nocardioides sp.]